MGKAQTRASNKYNAKAYDRIALQVKKDMREKLRIVAKEKGYESLNGYIKSLLEKDSGLDL